MRKFFLICLFPIILTLPKLLDAIGLAGTPEDLSTWGRWLSQIGITNFIAAVVLFLALTLFAYDIVERQELHWRMRLKRNLLPIEKCPFAKFELFEDCPIGFLGIDVPNQEIRSGQIEQVDTFVTHLQAKVLYKRRRPLLLKQAEFKSLSSENTLSPAINDHTDFESLTISGGAFLVISAELPYRMEVHEFREMWGGFTLSLATNRGSKIWKFPREYVEWRLFDTLVSTHWRRPKGKDTKGILDVVKKVNGGPPDPPCLKMRTVALPS